MRPRTPPDANLSFARLEARLARPRAAGFGASALASSGRSGICGPLLPRRRQESRSLRVSRKIAPALGMVALFFAAGCGRSDEQLARRILEDHRRKTASRPLPGSQIIRLALSSETSPATGTRQIEWGSQNYRETTSSAGATTVLGIQGGKAYFTDEDGVTRVVSEPVLARLLTRSYFWRRAWLFDDAEMARVSLGPADGETVSVRMLPRGGNLLEIRFARKDLRIAAVHSPGLDMQFDGPEAWREPTPRGGFVKVRHRWTGLPTGNLRDADAGGWSSVWGLPAVDAPLVAVPSGAVAVRGSVAGTDLLIALDGTVDGPLRVRPAVAGRLAWKPVTDVFGRRLVPGTRVSVGAWSQPNDFAEVTDDIPAGVDAVIGGGMFREVIVEYDAEKGKLRLHDPEKWVRPEGYYRCVLDDDSNRPVAILKSAAETLRVVIGATQPHPLALAEASALRAGFPPESRVAEKLRWSAAPLPALEMHREPGGFGPALGDDGRLSAAFLIRFHAVVDATHRWVYLKPEGAPAPKGE